MSQAAYQIRRATIEDLPALVQLWKDNGMPFQELEKRLTEFQVVLSENGAIIGAVGFFILARNALIHHEAFLLPEIEEILRELVWQRIEVLVKNHAIARLWTMEEAPFYQHFAGMKVAASEEMQNFPVIFGDSNKKWLTLKLHDDTHHSVDVDTHLELFRQHQQLEMEQLAKRTKLWRAVATMLSVILFIAVVVWGVLILLKRPIT